MKSYFEYLMILIFSICLILSFIFTNNSTSVFNKLVVVENKSKAISNLNVSVPDKMILKTNYGSCKTIKNTAYINKVLNQMNIIKNSSSNEKPIETNNSTTTLSGEIFYSNGHHDTFSVCTTLIFNGKTYFSNSYQLNFLHNILFDPFSNFSYLLKTLDSKDSSVELYDFKSVSTLTNLQKKNLKNALKNLTPLRNTNKFLIVNIENKKKFHLTVNINKNIKDKTANLIYIDAYSNYVIVQFLGNDTGERFYLEGSLNEKTL